jgi:hypothetical protein
MLEVTEFMAGVARFGVGRVRIVEDCAGDLVTDAIHGWRLLQAWLQQAVAAATR